MRKKLLTTLLFTTLGLASLNAQVINDFETGLPSTTNLTFRNQNGSFSILDCEMPPAFGTSIFPTFNAFNQPNEKVSIVASPAPDPILASYQIYQSVVGPNGGQHSIRLNDVTGGGADITSFEQPFIVEDEFLSFEYMVVLDSGHINNLLVQPFFTVRLLDNQNNIIQSTPFCIIADPAEPLLSNNKDILFYTPEWYCSLISIPAEYLGQELRVQFITADCGATGHRGVAYIDNIINKKACEKPEYGFINLSPIENRCHPNNAKVCGEFIAPKNSQLTSIELEILQNGVPVNVPPGTITNTSLTNNSFCFYVDFSSAGFTTGGYEFRVNATFTSSTNGYVYTLTDESTNIEFDVSFNGGAAPITYIDFDHTVQTISWPTGVGPYQFEFISDGEACCPKLAGLQPPYGTFASLTTNNTTISFYDGMLLLQSKCIRFRMRSQCSEWTQWCCITGYNEGAGGFELGLPGESYDCVDQINTLQQGRTAYVYPNATTGNITIKNSNSLNFELYDYSNNLILTKKIPQVQEEVKFDLSNLKQGIYILKTDNGQSIKVVKN